MGGRNAAEADIQEITRTGDIQGQTESPKSGLADEGVCRYFYETSLRRLDVGKCQFRLTTLPIYPALFCQTN